MKHRVVLTLLVAIAIAAPALAEHVGGTVYCDFDGDQKFSAGDLPMNGITMKAVSQGPQQPGAEFNGTSPYNATTGLYNVDLLKGPNDYELQVYGGLPQGATFLVPAGGKQALHVTADPASQGQTVDVLIGNCGSPRCTAASCDDGNPCTDDVCIPTKGCDHRANENPCDDGNACTTNDRCQNGACYGSAFTCDDGNVCTTDRCDPAVGCTHTNNTEPCDDGNACTRGDKCANGSCAGTPNGTTCDDHNPCTDDACGPNGCVHTNNTAQCDDGNPCTSNDVCAAGACAGIPKSCDDGNLCNGQETCNPQTGACESTPGPPPFLLCSDARFNNEATINGNVGVNEPGGFLRLSRGAFMPDGTTAAANEVELAAGASVCRVLANVVDANATAVIRCGTGAPVLPLLTPCCTIPPATCGNQPVLLGKNAVGAPLAPGAYGALQMKDLSSLTLLPGTFTFCSIDIAQAAQLVTTGVTLIHVTGDLSVADTAFLGPDTGQPLPEVDVGGANLRVGVSGTLRAIVKAPNAAVRLGRAATIEGTLCADTLASDKNITLTCLPAAVRPQSSGPKRHRHRHYRVYRVARRALP